MIRKLLTTNYSLLPSRNGQAALSLVFLTGGIIVLIGVSLAFLAISFINTSFAFQSANKALAAASAGVNDAMLQLTRDKDFASGGYYVPLPCTRDSATVTVDNSPANSATIVSQASSFNSCRKVQAVVSINQATTQVELVSWSLVPISQGIGCPTVCPL